ncbi:hypothetical protein PSYJYH_000057 [Bacillus phage PSYJ-YH]|nr:hypothetical protein PSYJYH_000057 [Bacillus phage PSYJ-YH]
MITFNSNASQLIASFERRGHNFKSRSENLVKDIAKAGFNSAVRDTPVDNGTLRRGWQLKPVSRSGGGISAGYGNNVEYVLAVNFGWLVYGKGKWHSGYYYLESSYQAVEREAQQRVARLIRDVMK